MARVVAIKETLEQALKDESKPWTRYLALAEKKSGLDRLYIFVASVLFLALYLVIGIGQQLVSNVIGFLYPAYCSMKAIETKEKDDDTKWLTYWVVFAFFTIVETFSDYIIGWFPVYWLAKCLFYIWLMIPTEYNGSLVLYRRIIRPRFLQYHTSVDDMLAEAKGAALKAAGVANAKKD
ncbi:receptor expression-enhancing protein 6 [Copidosoma floridanum]|uniref:receptor expression-enhancing protein 6 n=1 Tax=Copidosoma floridanum TaxID=29053 RepID=UPI0006C97831|nr:receptor expression-enhancing protein 6 [Copidosoma floridanum]